MHVRNSQNAKDALSKLLTPDDPSGDDPSTGGLAAAIGDVAPLDDAETILAENATGDPGEQTEGETMAQEAARMPAAPVATVLPAGNGLLTRVLGGLCLAGGAATAALQAQGHMPAALTNYGLQPTLLFTVGAVVFGIGLVRRQLARVEAVTARQQEAQAELQSNLQFLVERQHAATERPPAEGEELERVLIALERQDEKVNNLTKALKMYGKPLLEISSGSADLAGQISAVKAQTEGLTSSLQQGMQRVEAAARSAGNAGSGDATALREQLVKLEQSLQQQLAGLGEQVQRGTGPLAQQIEKQLQSNFGGVAEKITGLAEKLSHTGLQHQLTRMEASVQSIGQRLDDSEVRKSLLRLEDAEKQRNKKLDELARGDTLQQETSKLERQLELGLGKLNGALDQVRNGSLDGLSNTVRDIQRELAGLATAVSQIQQAVRSGATRAAATPLAPTPSPAPMSTPTMTASPTQAAATEPAPMAAAPKATPTPAAEPVDTKGLSDAQAGAAQNQTGTRATSSKNVLGAIAKLKKMKN